MAGTLVEVTERMEESSLETIGVVVEIPFSLTEVEGIISQGTVSIELTVTVTVTVGEMQRGVVLVVVEDSTIEVIELVGDTPILG